METEYLRCVLRAAHSKLQALVSSDLLSSDVRGVVGPLLASRGRALAHSLGDWLPGRRDDCAREAVSRTGRYLQWLAKVALADEQAGGPIGQELHEQARKLNDLAAGDFSEATYEQAAELAAGLVALGKSYSAASA